MTTKDHSVLFFGKNGDAHVERALRFCENNFSDVKAFLGDWGDPFPGTLGDWTGDYIFSYLSRWVIPAGLLGRAGCAALNFHPASPDYPGIGCNNFALYEGAKEYGATCHRMASAVDTGEIVAVKRFQVFDTDTVSSLLDRTYDFQLALFYDVVGRILVGEDLPISNEKWGRKAHTRRELNDLGRIEPGMSPEEIERRIRATTFGTWKPTIELGDRAFELKGD